MTITCANVFFTFYLLIVVAEPKVYLYLKLVDI